MSDDGLDLESRKVEQIACGQCNHAIDVSRLPVFSSLTCPKCGSKLTVPAILGNFLLLEELGQGGMGAVYRGMDQALGRFVAIKVMKASLGADPKLVESFLREARTAAALNHPNIVQIYSCGQEAGQPYIAMELVSGGRLDEMMADGKTVKEARLLEIALDVSEGLKAANGVGLVHGDIKPANILLDKNGTAKVVDFGLAQFVNAQQARGEVWGTPFYISPERARGALADHRSDIYSLGATLFHALAGKPPFDGRTAADVVLARLKTPAPDIREFSPLLQPETAAVISRMLEADTSRRYPTSASLQADLRNALAAAREAEKHGGKRRPPAKKSKTGLIFAVGAVVVVLAIAGLFSMVAKHHRENPQLQAIAAGPSQPEVLGETFFSDAESQKLAAAADDLTGGKTPLYIARLDKMSGEIPKNSARAVWMRLFRVVPLWIEARDRDAGAALASIADMKINQPDNNVLHMPKVLAAYLLDQMDDSEFNARAAPWPAWYKNLAMFYRGLQEFMWGDFLKGMMNLQKYTSTTSKKPEWAYAYQPVARKWMEVASNWDSVKRQSSKFAADGKADEARARLEKYMFEVPPFFRVHVDEELKRYAVASSPSDGPSSGAASGLTSAQLAREVKVGEWDPSSLEGKKGEIVTTNDFEISDSVQKAGPLLIRFQYVSGQNKLTVEWISLLVNGKEIARDDKTWEVGRAAPTFTCELTLPARAANDKVAIRAAWFTGGGRSTRGQIRLTPP